MKADIELVKLLWQFGLPTTNMLQTTDLHEVTIHDLGEESVCGTKFIGAELSIGSLRMRGTVLFSANDKRPAKVDTDAVLQVAPYPTTILCREQGDALPQMVIEIPPKIQSLYSALRNGSDVESCGAYIAGLKSVARLNLLTRLQIDRLTRKSNDVMELYDMTNGDWNQTMYLMLFRSMGGDRHKEQFLKLARMVPYNFISRERNQITVVESLLLGTSGLLELYPDDEYTMQLKDDFHHMQTKYHLTPMSHTDWPLDNIFPANHPIIRLAQLAGFLTTTDFVLDSVLNCRTQDDVLKLLRAEASEYWHTHFVPSRTTRSTPKKLGREKRIVLGINFITPMQIAYGKKMAYQQVYDSAIPLLESMDCESNRITKMWRTAGVKMENAFDAQAVIQLNNEYCIPGACAGCPVGKNLIREYCK